MVPMLDEAVELAAEAGAHEVVIGMAHRGRLNVLAHVVGRPYEVILREFEGERTIEAVARRPRGRHRRREVPPRRRGDAPDRERRDHASRSRRTRATSRRSTPSSRAGRAPSRPTARTAAASHDSAVALPVLIHGDASFAGPGRRRRDAQPRRSRRLHDRRHAAPDREQPGRLHDRAGRGPLDALLERPREGLRRRRSST